MKNFELWKQNLLHFSLETDPWLTREAAWHSYYLRSAALFDEYFENHFLPQGNAYTFLHGANGAIRDYILFTIPMIYQNPNLAREMLEYIFRTMTPNGELPYAIVGVGQEMGAMVHETSSDLHLWLLWGLLEYLYMTRDFDFLGKELPFYPLEGEKSSTVLEKILISVNFLFKKVGIGEHGLIKVGSGDWSDGISLLVKCRRKFLKKGESTFNSAFALYVIPRLIELLKKRMPSVVPFLEKKYTEIREACLKNWNGRWFYRAWEDSATPVGDTNLFLEHHPWLMLSNVVPQIRMEILLNNIYKILDHPSKTGQYILYPPHNVFLNILPRGWDVNGGIWHAINFLLTWAYARYAPDKAYQSLVKNTMKRRAEVYPNIWYGIWSGSDSYNAEYASNPGQTFIHPATPQTDFPIMNLNLHACILASIIKLVGINPTKKGLIIDPTLPQKTFQFQSPTITFNLGASEIKVVYRPVKEDECEIRIRKPNHWVANITATINGEPSSNRFTIEDNWLVIRSVIPITGLNFVFKCI
ncbi:MAG: GH36-type glycosyl hydrolase domain-containing protein [Candidatus Helarchaeota archaeon]